MKALIRITALIIAAVSFVSANAQDFEGVWYPLWNEGKFGSIKMAHQQKPVFSQR